MCVYRHTRVTACNFQNPYTCFEIKMAKEEAAKEELIPLLPSLEISTLISYLIDTLMFNLDLTLSPPSAISKNQSQVILKLLIFVFLCYKS